MHPSDRVPVGIAEEYRWKMKHNFKQYIYLGLKFGRWEDKQILPEIWNMEGYIAHRTIMYSDHWSHIYIKFENNNLARNAVDYFRNLDCNLNAEIVDNLLCSWYIYEYETDHSRQATAAHVDIVGIAPHCMNLMMEPVVAAVLKDFGEVQVLTVREAAAYVVFDSMAEALAAVIAHGKWEKNEQSYSQFYFRVRIIAADKEAGIISCCLSQHEVDPAPQEAFKLDYFVDPVEAGWGTVEHYNDMSVWHSSASAPTDTALQHRGRQIRGRSDIFTNRTLTGNSSDSGVFGYPSSMCHTRSLTETVLYNDFGVPLGTITVNNNYGLMLPPGNVQYARNMQEMRFNHSDIPLNVTLRQEYTENINRRAPPTLLCNRSFSENSVLNREKTDLKHSSNNGSATGFSSNNFRAENLRLNKSVSNHANIEAFTKNGFMKQSPKNSHLLPPSRDSSLSSAKPKVCEPSLRMESFRSLEFRSSKFKNNFSQSKNYRKK